MAVPTFPNVPRAPGVPAVFRSPLITQAEAVLASAEALLLLFGKQTPKWGLYDRQTGRPAIIADNVTSFDYRNQWAVADFPVEQGAFASYDKVNSPFSVRLRYTTGGTTADRQALLSTIEAAAATLSLFDAVCPERVYPNVNVAAYDYRRTATNGVGLLEVDVFCVEIRIVEAVRFVNTRDPAAADPVDGGTVQPVPATPKQSALASVFQ